MDASGGWSVVVGSVLVALIGFAGIVVTVKGGRKSGEQSSDIDHGVQEAQTLISVVRTYEGRLRGLEERQAKSERDLDAMGRKHRAAIRFVNAWRTYAAELQRLLLLHAPGQPLPLPPGVPAELIDDLRED